MQRELAPAVYLMASRRNGTLYLGVTSNLELRVAQHRAGTFDGFAERHDLKLLVWFERHGSIEEAIARGKRIKKWLRKWKLELIERENPEWRDLAVDFGFDPLRRP